MKIKILTDSSCDLPITYIRENSEFLDFLGMPITIGDEEYIDDLGDTFSHDEFYKRLTEGAMPKTSQINTSSFIERFRSLHEAGYDVIYIGLSSGLSGTINNANLARSILAEEMEHLNVAIIDSLAGSIGLGAIVVSAVDMVKAQMSFDEIAGNVEANKLNANHWFAVDDLMHLKNGGRIPSAVAYVGTVLKVKPILTMKHDGKLESYSSVRGKKKAYKYLVSKVTEHLPDKQVTILVGHANILEDADMLVSELREQGVENPIIETCLSATIASHVGPGMLAMAFMAGKTRENK